MFHEFRHVECRNIQMITRIIRFWLIRTDRMNSFNHLQSNKRVKFFLTSYVDTRSNTEVTRAGRFPVWTNSKTVGFRTINYRQYISPYKVKRLCVTLNDTNIRKNAIDPFLQDDKRYITGKLHMNTAHSSSGV